MHYRVSYSFATPDDPYNNGIQDVSEAFYDVQSEGAEIVVRFIPSDASINAVEPESMAKLFGLTLVASVGLVLVGLTGGALAIRRARNFAKGL